MEQRIIEQAVAGLERWRVFYHRERELECDEGVVTLAVVYCDEAGEQRQAFMDAVKAGIRASESPFSQEPLIVNYGKGGIALCWNILHSSGMSCPLSSTSIPDYISDVRSIGRAASRALSGRARRAGGGDMFQVPLPDESPSPSVNGIEVKGDLSAYIWPDSLESLAAAMKGKSNAKQEFYEQFIFDENAVEEEEDVLLLADGQPFIRRHDLTMVHAVAKAGKSTLLAILTAAAVGNAPALIFERRKDLQPLYVLVCDTEMAGRDIKGKKELVKGLAGTSTPGVEYLKLRGVSPTDILKAIENALQVERPDICIIDGITDLLKHHNINSEEDSGEIVSNIIALADKYCAIIVAIHDNTGSGAANRARGHIGSELDNKVEHNLRLTAQRNGTRTIYFGGRRQEEYPSEPISFIKDDGGLHLIEKEEMRKRAANRGPTFWADHLEPGRTYRRVELETILKEWNPSISDDGIKSILSKESKNGILHKINNDAYVLP